MMKTYLHRAFSLVELMVVIAIVGLMLTIAIPIYTSNVNKVNITAIVNKMGNFKLQMVDNYTSTGAWPAALNGATAPATISDSSFANDVAFRYNTSGNMAWWGYQLSNAYGGGWIFMLAIANADGSYDLHCGSLSTSCTYGSCNSATYYPQACSETDLSTTYSLSDS